MKNSLPFVLLTSFGLYLSGAACAQERLDLEFRLVHPKSKELLDQGITEPAYEVLKLKEQRDGRTVVEDLLVKKRPELTGRSVSKAVVTRRRATAGPANPKVLSYEGAQVTRWRATAEPANLVSDLGAGIDFTLDAQGTAIFAQVTRDNVGRRLAIVLDGEVISAPVIKSPIETGTGVIEGRFDSSQAEDLAKALENHARAAPAPEPTTPAATIRAGMIGLDTSHVPAFAKIFNQAKADSDLAGIKVVAGYPGGTDLPASRNRVKGFTEELRGMGIEIVDSIPKLLERVDVVLLESVDGRIHLKEAVPVLEAGKPMFIDKPAAGSLADAIAIYDLARQQQVPCFSSSSLRFSPSLVELKKNRAVGQMFGAITWGPCSYQEGIPDMFYYGIHGIEMLYVLMGTGCETVSRVQAEDADVLTGVWAGGRVGTYRGLRRQREEFGAVAFGTQGIVPAGKSDGYEQLCFEIARFFKTRKAPVAAEETIELLAFMEAADESNRHGGAPVLLKDVLAKARAAAASKH
ncbi:MAG TPA: Gfo/Idh/MocA family oxidoreductase [Dongiaceae bacterium]|nr:Gfo/Idh/MocA family oxidoreductase [Dongiaceae bacterium]